MTAAFCVRYYNVVRTRRTSVYYNSILYAHGWHTLWFFIKTNIKLAYFWFSKKCPTDSFLIVELDRPRNSRSAYDSRPAISMNVQDVFEESACGPLRPKRPRMSVDSVINTPEMREVITIIISLWSRIHVVVTNYKTIKPYGRTEQSRKTWRI